MNKFFYFLYFIFIFLMDGSRKIKKRGSLGIIGTCSSGIFF